MRIADSSTSEPESTHFDSSLMVAESSLTARADAEVVWCVSVALENSLG